MLNLLVSVLLRKREQMFMVWLLIQTCNTGTCGHMYAHKT